MFKRLLQFLLLAVLPVYAQTTYTYPALSTQNVWSNANTFNGPVTFNGAVTASSLLSVRQVDPLGINSYTTIQNAINSLPTAGNQGGSIYLQPGLTYACPTSIPSGVTITSLGRAIPKEALTQFNGNYVATTPTGTSGSTTLTLQGVLPVYIGESVTGTGVASNTTIVSGTGTPGAYTAVVLSNALTGNVSSGTSITFSAGFNSFLAGPSTANLAVIQCPSGLTINDVSRISMENVVLDMQGTGCFTLNGVGYSEFAIAVVNVPTSCPEISYVGDTANGYNSAGNRFTYFYGYGGNGGIVGAGSLVTAKYATNTIWKDVEIHATAQPAGMFTPIYIQGAADSNIFEHVDFFALPGVTATNGNVLGTYGSVTDTDADGVQIHYYAETLANSRTDGCPVVLNYGSNNVVTMTSVANCVTQAYSSGSAHNYPGWFATYSGSTYMSVKDNGTATSIVTPGTNTAYWMPVTFDAGGYKAVISPPSVSVATEYASGTTYSYGQFVKCCTASPPEAVYGYINSTPASGQPVTNAAYWFNQQYNSPSAFVEMVGPNYPAPFSAYSEAPFLKIDNGAQGSPSMFFGKAGTQYFLSQIGADNVMHFYGSQSNNSLGDWNPASGTFRNWALLQTGVLNVDICGTYVGTYPTGYCPFGSGSNAQSVALFTNTTPGGNSGITMRVKAGQGQAQPYNLFELYPYTGSSPLAYFDYQGNLYSPNVNATNNLYVTNTATVKQLVVDQTTSGTIAAAITPGDNSSSTKEIYGTNAANSAYVWWINDDGSTNFGPTTVNGVSVVTGGQNMGGAWFFYSAGGPNNLNYTNSSKCAFSGTGDVLFTCYQSGTGVMPNFIIQSASGKSVFFEDSTGAVQATLPSTGPIVLSSLSVNALRKGTFTCTAGGSIVVVNSKETATSDVVITLNTPGGTISTPPAIKAITPTTSFTVLCGASDTSVYNYDILN